MKREEGGERGEKRKQRVKGEKGKRRKKGASVCEVLAQQRLITTHPRREPGPPGTVKFSLARPARTARGDDDASVRAAVKTAY